ncbi:MAG: AAA family ATPase [Candidatus Korarchaeota archaeon]|nr:AAA family ATPase [Candidatus Korarchaeota archaeon]NIU83608.1 AAA family ATPase [Candidatus Thorarchaeota archaeon]NIW14116.1 AAA family ATPase [Candidatus Thorarchaeota archaeon]NIW52223.1 AAA family ATPase [Candidatus Korarchaeota archaeon]
MGVDRIFDNLLSNNSLFKDKKVLTHDYVPENLPHREREVSELASVLAAALRGEGRPSNVFMYGKSGTGKTVLARFVVEKLKSKGETLGLTFSSAYLNTRYRKTNYRVLASLCEELGGTSVPATGLPTDVVFDRLQKIIDSGEHLVVIILDEIDWLVKHSGDDLLYQLTRVNNILEKGEVSLVGITNDLKFREYLDRRVISSLGEESIVFNPYDAEELFDILRKRSKIAFKSNVLKENAIKVASAIAAREHGDARRAIDLLRVAGEIAEREKRERVTKEEILKAREKVEKNVVKDTIIGLPLQEKLLLLALGLHAKTGRKKVKTGELKETYESVCREMGHNPVSLRRINDLLSDLEMLGLVTSNVKSFGRYGRSRVSELEVSPGLTVEAIQSEKNLEFLAEQL